ncbi:N-acetylated-alpha-linked acidic dipeptidase 2-like [Branchiostoma floridae]|uniref:Glutamate carboxypeptidase 2 n=1 Tax=Branchiostoma floridae TaxID=7739 RepID=A0A9J7MRV1_BRAFL|nr:N-acetylated-alpha-linked acidic dipeptidase 2-like [Branchiostoma floridae]
MENMSRNRVIFISVVVGVLGIVVGVLIGYFSRGSATGEFADFLSEGDAWVAEALRDEISAKNIEENLRYLTSKPHLAGTPEGKAYADWVVQKWREQGLDDAYVTDYNILLSYPDRDSPSYIALLDENDRERFRTAVFEEAVDAETEQWLSSIVQPFNAYSAPGTVQGDVVYVNYARVEDYERLRDQLGIDVTGKVVIARYGKIFRGEKAKYSQEFGAAGLILYTDPEDTVGSGGEADMYPRGWYLPGSGVQRGNILNSAGAGEPLTPGYPAKDYMFRIEQNETDALARIPVHPIGYSDAWHILNAIGGPAAPAEWAGGLNITYRLGPGFDSASWARSIKMNISVRNERRDIFNTVGVIRGRVEPDRYVIMGNHRDSWTLGSVDPTSGTAVMVEVTRAFMEMVKRGWRPRRSLMFCSWDAEEYGLHGSMEHVEEFHRNLASRAVVYINIDTAVMATYTLRPKVSPSARQEFREATKRLPWPETVPEGTTMYDVWRKRSPNDPDDPDTQPRIDLLGSGSDFAGFVHRVGVSCIDLGYTFDTALGVSSYPLYHTGYETFHLQADIIDPGFKFNRGIAQLAADLIRGFADPVILPFDLMEYANYLGVMRSDLQAEYGTDLTNHGISSDSLDSAIRNFTDAAQAFHSRLQGIDKNNPFEVRMFNDQLMQLERAFIDPLGLPGRPFYRHTLMAPSKHNKYVSDPFPGLTDTIFDAERSADPAPAWREVAKQMSIIAFNIQSAASTLMMPA